MADYYERLSELAAGSADVSCAAAFEPGNRWRPFCSQRCKTIDLGAWAAERYRISGDVRNEDAASSDEDESGERPHRS